MMGKLEQNYCTTRGNLFHHGVSPKLSFSIFDSSINRFQIKRENKVQWSHHWSMSTVRFSFFTTYSRTILLAVGRTEYHWKPDIYEAVSHDNVFLYTLHLTCCSAYTVQTIVFKGVIYSILTSSPRMLKMHDSRVKKYLMHCRCLGTPTTATPTATLTKE